MIIFFWRIRIFGLFLWFYWLLTHKIVWKCLSGKSGGAIGKKVGGKKWPPTFFPIGIDCGTKVAFGRHCKGWVMPLWQKIPVLPLPPYQFVNPSAEYPLSRKICPFWTLFTFQRNTCLSAAIWPILIKLCQRTDQIKF